MKNKKKLIIIIAAILIAAVCIAAAVYFIVIKADKEPTLRETVDNRIAAYETDLRDSLASMTDQKAVAKYLTNWAEHKGIEAKADKSNNVIFSIKATEGLENESPVVIICSYDYSCMESYINSIVTALTVAKNDNPHGAYNIIFISQEMGSVSGAENLSAQYFPENARVFYLGNSSSSRIADMTGGYEHYTLSRDISTASPSYNKAYRITISGLPAQSFSGKSSSAPNPIKTLGNLLANFKSTSILFELASFSGGSSANLVPTEASMTIVVNEDSSAKLEKKLDNSVEKFYDKYQDKYSDVQYTYEVVEMPSQIISQDDTESIVSLLYTSLSGVHYKDDAGDIVSIANIGSISAESGRFVMKASAASYDAELLSEITETYQTTGFLSGMDCNVDSEYGGFTVNESGKLIEEGFREAYSDYQSVKLESVNMPEFTPCGIISAKNDGMSMIAIGVTERTKDNFAGGLITYLGVKGEE